MESGKAPREGAVMCVLGRAAKGCTYLQAVRGEVADSSVGLEKGVGSPANTRETEASTKWLFCRRRKARG